jgi:hypothetical protein
MNVASGNMEYALFHVTMFITAVVYELPRIAWIGGVLVATIFILFSFVSEPFFVVRMYVVICLLICQLHSFTRDEAISFSYPGNNIEQLVAISI